MKFRILLVLLVLVIALLCSCSWGTPNTPDHTHTFEDTYSNNDTHHWYACECGEKDALAEHVWNDGVVNIIPTPDSDGIKTFTCLECGRKNSEKITYDEYNGGTGENPDLVLDGLEFLKSTFFKMDDKLPTAPLTLEADIYVDPNFTGRVGSVFSNYMGIRQDWHFEISENGVPRFYYHDAGANVRDIRFTEVDVRTGDWVHIAFTFDYANGVMSVYLNGELAQSITCTANLAEDITMYRFIVGGDGRSDNGNYFKGQIKSIAAYSDVRTAEELAESAANGVDSDAEGILVHYVLNKDSGNDDIEDLSPNGYKISKEWLDSNVVDLDYAYSFAVVGDTQWLSKYKPEKMKGIYDWILANKDSKKIAHVFGLGDITEDWNTANKEQEWIRAYDYISMLDGKISYSLVRGNHDESKYFSKYFANETYMSQFDGFMVEGDIRNVYKLFTIGSTDYLFLVLDFGPSDEILAWANDVVLAHPNHRVIVTTHGYQAFNGDRISNDNVTSYGGTASQNDVDTSDGNNFRGYNNGEQVWQKFISRHPNIFLVLSGHTSMEDVTLLQTKGNHGNVVNQMLIDPQWMDPQKDGVGMLCMLYFSEDGSKMEVEWLSTDTGKYYQEHNQFQLDLTDSFNASAHVFTDTYNEKSHHKACDCGYIYDEEPHAFDGGVLNSEGFMVYSCECGYQRIASATNDPIALELQALLEKYYNNGVYYKSTVIGTEPPVDAFFDGDKFWSSTGTELGATSSVLSLTDIILGKYGDISLDLGWNYNEGVYTSTNEITIHGFELFVSPTMSREFSKVTVEEANHHIIIKLWAEDNAVTTTEVGLYAKTTFIVNHAEAPLVSFTKSDNEGMCKVIAPTVDGYVAEYDYFILSTIHDELSRTVYYSKVSVWDGSVSDGLQGSGSKEDPFLVTSGADLAYIASVVNAAAEKTPNFAGKYFKLTQSIDLNGLDLHIGDFPGWADRKGFYGFFDGNHCTIRGLNNTKSLFGTIETGYLKNLSVYGKVNGNTTIGGIVGYAANGGVLENLTNYATVTGVNTLGGVVGNSENQASTVINCVNYGNVTGSSYIIGGVAGSGGHDIINCVNYGNVTSTGSDCVGGIVGSTKNTGKIENCYNYGTVKARGQAGGIVGLGNKPVNNCVNYGDVSGTWALAGIVGYTKNDASIIITNCVNNGNITGTSTAIGGIFGLLDGNTSAKGTAEITDCINNGNVKGSWGVGGIAADTIGLISGCVNNGEITASGEVGGIIGKAYERITDCTNYGKVVATQDMAGGIVGHLHVATYIDEINTTNENYGVVEGQNSGSIIGKAN